MNYEDPQIEEKERMLQSQYVGCRSKKRRSYNSRLIKGRSCDDVNHGVNTQGQIRWRTHKADTRAVWGTTNGEEYSERLILGSVKQLISFKNQNVGSGL